MQPRRLCKLAVQINAILAASCYSLAAGAAPVEIADRPLAGVELEYAPNLVLALSVEFPTSGAAYTTKLDGSPNNNATDLEEVKKIKYQGYFNPDECYSYNKGGKYFLPVAKANKENGLCENKDDLFSGSLMNFLSASALDVFRKEMTGGNRALGPEKGKDALKAYQAGDKVGETYLRRSYKQHSSMENRFLKAEGATADDIRKLLPKEYLSANFAQDIISKKSGQNSKGDPRKLGFKAIVFEDSKPKFANEVVPEDAFFYDSNIYFYNHEFGGYFFRKVSDSAHPSGYAAAIPTMENNMFESISVKVCVPGHEESNCVPYSGGKKPEGLLQKYGRKGMRVAAFGYLNDDDYAADAPVLRARMKYLNKDNEGGLGGTRKKEWDEKTGIFALNPDSADAAASHVPNSGVINYLNKFGDYSGYKTYDIAGELYYAALRYLRNLGAVYVRSPDEKMKDQFPAIYNWDDPLTNGLKEGVKSREAQCRANNIIFIGDTNTHNDWNLPNFKSIKYQNSNGSLTAGNPPTGDALQTRTYLQALLENEGLGGASWEKNRGSTNSPAGIAGVAYWARVNDIRPDIDGDQFGNNFFVDVAEYSSLKGQDNAYWLAAKYGGFSLDKDDVTEKTLASYGTFKMPAKRSAWTDDPLGTSSIPGFFAKDKYGASQYPGTTDPNIIGIPKNYGLANNPTEMAKTLRKAFGIVGSFSEPSQTAPGLTTSEKDLVDPAKGITLLTAHFNLGKMSGNLIVQKVTYDSKGKPLFTSGWKAENALNDAFHKAGVNKSRKVFTRKDGQTVDFNGSALTMKKPENADSLANYVLGDSSEEGTKWRKRTSILGPIINSSPLTILPPKNEMRCSFDNASTVKNRPTYYAAAANDGMLHIFDPSRNTEAMAYIPSTALSKLESLADPDATFQYINDGLMTYADVCMNNKARSVLIGTTGRGGASVYALDVTNLTSPNKSNVLWEFSDADDPDLGLTIPQVAITNNKNHEPIAILGNGYNNKSGNGYLFVLNINNLGTSWGGQYQKIRLGNAAVAKPFVYDENQDGIPERVYVGDYAGKLWRVDYNKDTDTWTVAYNGNPMFSTDNGAPITGAPYATTTDGKTYVVVGTGQYLNESGTAADVQNYAYGLIDDSSNTSPISASSLLDQNIDSRVDYNKDTNRTLWSITKNAFIEGTHRGWRLKLNPGQAIASNALVRGDTLAEFVVVRRTDDGSEAAKKTNPCMISGSTGILSVDLKNGGEYEKAVFDTNGDMVADSKDKKGGFYELNGIITPSAAVVSGEKADYYNFAGQESKDSFAVRNFKRGQPVFIRANKRLIDL